MPAVPKCTVRVFDPLEEKAAQLRDLAQTEPNEELRGSLVAVARQYEESAERPQFKKPFPFWGCSVVPPMSAKVLAMMAALVAQMLAAMPDYDVELALANLINRTNAEDIAVKDSAEFHDSGFSIDT